MFISFIYLEALQNLKAHLLDEMTVNYTKPKNIIAGCFLWVLGVRVDNFP